jgi:putative nucleotidyltransferase-like protein
VSAVKWSVENARLVCLCAREPANASDADIEAAARAIADWSATIKLASAHGVAAYLRQSLERAGVMLPADASAALRGTSIGAVAHVLSLTAQLERISQLFARIQIPVIVLKGPALAATIYPAASLRPYGDLDLTVHKGDEERAAAALVRLGLVEVPFEVEEARRAHADHGAEEGFHRLFIKEPENLLVELHVDPLQLGLRPVCEPGRWERALPIPKVNWTRMLSLEDQLVQLSVHALKHGFSRLIWLKDIELILAKGELNWELVQDVARLEGVGASVWYSVHLAARLLGFAVPTELRRLRPALLMRTLYGVIWPEQRVVDLAGRPRWRSVQFRVADSWRGMLPSLVLMGRRRDRARAVVQALWGRRSA